MNDGNIITAITQVSTAGGFAWLVYYFVRYFIPARDAEHREERNAAWVEIAKRDIRIEEITKSYQDTVRELFGEFRRVNEQNITVMTEVVGVLRNVKHELERRSPGE